MNKHVTFEVAKLLKENGLKLNICHNLYYRNPINENEFVLTEMVHDWELIENREDWYSAPTIVDVVMWLYEKHGIWIQAPFSHNDIKPFCWVITTTKRNISEEDENRNCWLSGIDDDNLDGYNSPTEAYLAAIEYILQLL